MICRQCGNSLAATARFCGRCGGTAAANSPEMETETAVIPPGRMAGAGAPQGVPPGQFPPQMGPRPLGAPGAGAGPQGMPPRPAGMQPVPQPPLGPPPGMGPQGMPPHPAGMQPLMQPPMGPPPGVGPRPGGQARAGGNTGIVIALCALATVAMAFTGIWAYKKLAGGGISGEATAAARLYPIMALDMTKERTNATGERDVLPVVLVSDGLEVLVPYSEGWGLPLTWDLAMVIGSGNLPECMILTRNRTEMMWVNRDGRMIRKPEAMPMGCKGPLLPARAANGAGLCGYADAATLRFRIAPAFQACEPFADGRALVTKEGKMQYIDASGNTVIPPKFLTAASFSEGLAAVRSVEKNELGYIDPSGNYVINPSFRTGTDFHEGLAAVEMQPSGLVGFIDKSGRTVIQPKYREVVSDFKAGRALVKSSDRVVLIDKGGRELAEWADNRAIRALGEGIFEVKFGNEAYLADRNGKSISKGKYRQIWPYQSGYAVAIGEQQSVLLDSRGNEALKAGKTLLGQYGGRYLTRLTPDGGSDLIDLSGNARLRLEKGILTRNPKP